MLDWNIGDEVWVNTRRRGSYCKGTQGLKETFKGIVLPGTNGKKFDPKKKEIGTFSI